MLLTYLVQVFDVSDKTVAQPFRRFLEPKLILVNPHKCKPWSGSFTSFRSFTVWPPSDCNVALCSFTTSVLLVNNSDIYLVHHIFPQTLNLWSESSQVRRKPCTILSLHKVTLGRSWPRFFYTARLCVRTSKEWQVSGWTKRIRKGPCSHSLKWQREMHHKYYMSVSLHILSVCTNY